MKKFYNISFFLIGLGALIFSAGAFLFPVATNLEIMGQVVPPWAGGLAVALVFLSPSFAVVVKGSPLLKIVSIFFRRGGGAVVLALSLYSCTSVPVIHDSSTQRNQIEQTVNAVDRASESIKSNMRNNAASITCNDPEILATLNNCKVDLVRAKSTIETFEKRIESDQSAMQDLEALRGDAETWRAIKRNSLIFATIIIIIAALYFAAKIYFRFMRPLNG